MNRAHQLNLIYFLFVFAMLFAFQFWLGYRNVSEISYSEFETYLSSKQIAQATVSETLIEGKFVTPQNGAQYFVTRRVDPDIAEKFAEAGVKLTGRTDQNWLATLLSWILPVLLFFALWQYFFRAMAARGGLGGLTTIGKSRAKVYVETATGVKFADVAGADFRACSKRSRTRAAPTPTNISTNSEPEIEKKGTAASPATARANSVFPVPGGPTSSMPFGMRAPSRPYFSRSLRKETISCNSDFASSTPATSANFTPVAVST